MGAHKEHAHIAVTHRWRHRARVAEARVEELENILEVMLDAAEDSNIIIVRAAMRRAREALEREE